MFEFSGSAMAKPCMWHPRKLDEQSQTCQAQCSKVLSHLLVQHLKLLVLHCVHRQLVLCDMLSLSSHTLTAGLHLIVDAQQRHLGEGT